ncbi:hypothetical protein BDD43_0337 [Mucilaginibacter gracilis]|uniref:Uncharacterized protein n=1 Tax=Mucilaginibacter gracilis TaxID=423350 RepID=A0A495IVA3_9SPHI|nr:hypothetical protein [Mucilaginibacter gracilis]RKR80241.1 hypothetical protein BDD43_0337 [Mucilaginibacter gracilis]
MKTISTAFLLTIACLSAFAQKHTAIVKIFKVTTFQPNGSITIQMDTVKESYNKLDLTYFAKHYNYPKPWLPDSLRNPIYKSQKVVVSVGERDDKKFHYSTYTVYDSLSRVTAFGTTACMVCNFLPSEYRVVYNTNGNIEKITKSYMSSSNAQNLYTIAYFPSGNINEFDCFNYKTLVKRIELL